MEQERGILSPAGEAALLRQIGDWITSLRYGKINELMNELLSAASNFRLLARDLRQDRERLVALAALVTSGVSPKEAQERVSKMHDSFISY